MSAHRTWRRLAAALVLGLGAAGAAVASAAPSRPAPSTRPTPPAPPTSADEPEAAEATPASEPAAEPATPAADPNAEPASPAVDPNVEPAAEPAAAEIEPAAVPIDGPVVLDGVLPCGLRVLVAEDLTLPVAAVVLAVETGPEDDPADRPGLVHALAFHLLQGNRELPPGGAAALVHDAGGITEIAVGPAQIRFESLVPVSRLDAAVWTEAQRLRAPTVSDELWSDSLRWARRDKPRPWGAPRAAIAAAHRAPGLSHEGRVAGAELQNLSSKAVALALADRFDYARATLVVVAPQPPAKTLDAVMQAFADLPPAVRHVRPRRSDVAPGSAPRLVEHPDGDGELFVWPIGPSPTDLARATVWCKALNRQKRGDGEPARARVRCHLDEDPRRGALVVRATGVDDPEALLRARVQRIFDGSDDALVDRQREVVLDGDRYGLRAPLPLARRLACSDARGPGGAAVAERSLDALTGLDALAPGSPLQTNDELSLPASVRIVASPYKEPDEEPDPKPEQSP